MKIWPLLVNIISIQVYALSPSLQNRRHFPGPPSTRLLPLWRLHCFHTVYREDGISVLGTDRSQKKQYQENMGDEEGFQIHIQSQQSLQLVTCGQGRCPARAEHRESVFLASFFWFPGVATSTLLPIFSLCYKKETPSQRFPWSIHEFSWEAFLTDRSTW